jgi:lipopolysaccharide transport system permease protein
MLSEETPQAAAVEVQPPAPDLPITVIEPRPGWRIVDLRELWRYRELLYFLAWRDVKVRYKQTVLGAAWAVLQPLATMLAFTLFLGRVASAGTGPESYALFVLAGLIPWTFFASAISSASTSLVGNQNLVTKVYFPRVIIPMSAAGAALVDLAVAFGLLVVAVPFTNCAPGWNLLLLPVVVLLMVVTVLGVGILLAALTVAYRDFRYVVAFMVQFWMFATPSIYLPVEMAAGPRGRMVLPLNPAYGLILNFRQAVLGGPIDWYALAVSGAVGIAVLLVGALYFRRVERTFADII